MKNRDDILKRYLSEQIALEEHLCRIIEDQIEEIEGPDFADAKSLLTKTRLTLEQQFEPLNALLDKLESDALIAQTKAAANNGGGVKNPLATEQHTTSISKILCNDYSALNLITISNTLLHTTALALQCDDVAATALKHLENLAPLVIKIGQLMPEVLARELHQESPTIDVAVAQAALENTRRAWHKAS
jgi:hypothetical protein